MKPNVEFSKFALVDIEEIWNYTASHNVDAAENSMLEFRKRFQLLGANPLLGFTRDDLIVNLREFPHKNFNIFYFPTENGIEVYRVLHASRDTVQLFEDSIDEIT